MVGPKLYMHTSAFASFSRGRPPARHTKVVDNNLGPLKAGSTRLCVLVCGNDATSSKPASAGRAIVDDHTHTNKVSCAVRVCCSKRCKTCTYVSQGSTFKSTVTHKNYSVVSPNISMTCDTENLITCRKCGIQYVGETGQKLRSRVNNHRNRLRQLSNLYLYQHFNSDGHSEEDISIMPIEEVTCTSGSTGVSLSAKRLEREGYWYRELCTVYPYGLNDNVRKVGNVSKCSQEMVVNTLFNRQPRKFKKRQQQRHRRKVDLADLAAQVDTLLSEYKSYTFCFNFRNLVLNLPKKCMMALSTIIDNWVATNDVPDRVMVLAKDLIAYKKRAPRMETNDVMKNSKNASGFMTMHYHNKGIEMLELYLEYLIVRVSRMQYPLF